MKRLLSCLCLMAVASLAPTPARAAEGTDAPKTDAGSKVTWQQLSDAIAGWMALSRYSQNRWELAIYEPPPGTEQQITPLQAAARDTMKAAYKDVAWIVTEVTYRRFLMPGVTFKVGEQIKLADYYCRAFLKTPSFTDPLRRFSGPALSARGLTCEDCSTGLRPAREVPWTQVREYIKDFIFVKEVTANGRVDLRVGSIENALPEFAYTDQDVGAACFSMMQNVVAHEPLFQSIVKQNLDEELLKLGEMSMIEARERLNSKVPARILEEPAALEMIGKWLPEALKSHGLICPTCPPSSQGGAQSVGGRESH